MRQPCHSDMILLSNLDSDISNEDLLKAFKNIQYDVTCVKRSPKSRSGIAYFSDFRGQFLLYLSKIAKN